MREPGSKRQSDRTIMEAILPHSFLVAGVGWI
jgi:hypothetical protein